MKSNWYQSHPQASSWIKGAWEGGPTLLCLIKTPYLDCTPSPFSLYIIDSHTPTFRSRDRWLSDRNTWQPHSGKTAPLERKPSSYPLTAPGKYLFLDEMWLGQATLTIYPFPSPVLGQMALQISYSNSMLHSAHPCSTLPLFKQLI